MTIGDVVIKALEEGWTQDEFDQEQLNNIVTYTLICSLSKNEYTMVYILMTAKEIWDSLKQQPLRVRSKLWI